MDSFGGNSDLRATSSVDQYDAPIDAGCSSGQSATDCRAVLLSERGLFLDGLRGVLAKSRITVIGEAPTIQALLDVMRTRPAPELVICHVAFGRTTEAVRDMVSGLRRHFGRAKLVVLADAGSASQLSSAAAAGVDAILLTSISTDMLLQALELVRFDHCLFPSAIIPLLAGGAQGEPRRDPAPAATTLPPSGQPADSAMRDDGERVLPALSDAAQSGARPDGQLSRREWQVLDCLVRGLPNKRIAQELNIVEGTVKVYLKCLSRRLKLRNRTQLAIWALNRPGRSGADKASDSPAVPALWLVQSQRPDVAAGHRQLQAA